MMAHPFPATMGGPGHPGMPNAHPMGMPHPGPGHMGNQPGPGMMQGLHPGVTGPQVTQGPMVTGMPPGAGTPALMQQNGMAMTHLGPQHIFQQGGQGNQLNLGQMQQMNNMLRQQHMLRQGVPMHNPGFQQMPAQMKMTMPMQQQQQQHLQNMQQQQQQYQHHQQQQQQHARQQQHQQQMMAQQHAAQQQAAMRQAQNQQAAQQMQMSRSQEQTSQPPQPMPTPAPSNQAPQPQPQANIQQQPPQQTPKPQPQQQPTLQQATPAASIKASDDVDETQVKQQEVAGQIMMQDIPKQHPNDITGQCILQLILYQDKLANPERATDLGYWEDIIQKYFSPAGSIRQQLYNNKTGKDKSYQLHYPSLARFFYTHFTSGIKQILMQSFDHNQAKLPNGGIRIWSDRASLTYVFGNDLRVTTQGSLRVNFDEMQRIEHMYIATTGWTEYVPRHLLSPSSPNQTSPKMTTKNAKKPQKPINPGPAVPSSGVGDFGMPLAVLQFLEIAEVMTAMGPLMEFFNSHPGMSPREALLRIGNEGAQMNMARMQPNANMMAVNGQMGFPQQRMSMNMPNQLQSPALHHLGLPHAQGSPGMASNHTGSPAQSQGGIPMMHQMSAQGSNMSGPSTNTSPSMSNKRRRPSGVKMEDENGQPDGSGGDKVKPSPRIGGKRQKGQA